MPDFFNSFASNMIRNFISKPQTLSLFWTSFYLLLLLLTVWISLQGYRWILTELLMGARQCRTLYLNSHAALLMNRFFGNINSYICKLLWKIAVLERCPNAYLKISLYVLVHMKVTPWKFHILNPQNCRVIYLWNFYFS